MKGFLRTPFLAASILLGACSEAVIGPVEQPALRPPMAILNCQGSTQGVVCGPESSTGALGDVVYGGQNSLVKLAGGTVSFVNPTLSQVVTVQNLLAQPLGTTNWTTVDANAVRVFMHSPPTNGVTWTSADGTGTFTASNQQYMLYNEIIPGNGINATARTWTFNLPTSGTTFTFQVAITTALPNETGGAGANIPAHTFASLGAAGVVAGHQCGIRTGGSIYCWGQGAVGELGISPRHDNNQPIQALDPTLYSAVSASAGHTCGLTTVGGVRCWGNNATGQLGNNTTTQSDLPVFVSGLGNGVSAVSAGTNHTCAITTSNALLCWGGAAGGQLGEGTTSGNKTSPQSVTGLSSGVTQVSAGGIMTCAVVSGGVKCWGLRLAGQLGDGGTDGAKIATPIDVAGVTSGVTEVATGGNNWACAIQTGGVKCWGDNAFGEMGNGLAGAAGTAGPQLTPTYVAGLGASSNVIHLALTRFHGCALITGGTVKCWGTNSAGQMGQGSTNSTPSTTAVAVPITTVDAISAGGLTGTTCAHLTNLTIKCWGGNGEGMIGDGTNTNRTSPTSVILP